MKKLLCLALALILLLTLCACGGAIQPAYRQIEVLGIKEYGLVFRSGDASAQYVLAALDTLAGSGRLSSISHEWLGSDRICLLGDSGALGAVGMPEPRTYIIGVEGDCKPMCTFDGAVGYLGMSVDIARAIGELLGWEIRLQPITSGELDIQLLSGNIDCAVGFGTETLDPGDFVWSESYMQAEIVLFSVYDAKIKRLRQLKDTKVGFYGDESVVAALEAHEKLNKHAGGFTEYSSLKSCLKSLNNGSCKAAVMDVIVLNANS